MCSGSHHTIRQYTVHPIKTSECAARINTSISGTLNDFSIDTFCNALAREDGGAGLIWLPLVCASFAGLTGPAFLSLPFSPFLSFSPASFLSDAKTARELERPKNGELKETGKGASKRPIYPKRETEMLTTTVHVQELGDLQKEPVQGLCK